jgi:hypothetical protein
MTVIDTLFQPLESIWAKSLESVIALKMVQPLIILALFLLLSSGVLALPVNIHVKLDVAGEQLAQQVDLTLHSQLPHDQIFLNSINQPHVTLYLTDFGNNIPELLSILTRLAPKLIPCPLILSSFTVNGSYSFWGVENTACLQRLSDIVVNNTYHLAAPNQPAPSWLNSLPPLERAERLHLNQVYGSPNVFAGFAPHITICYDDSASDPVQKAISALPTVSYSSFNRTIGAGAVGNWGSVLRGQDFADFPLYGDINVRDNVRDL